MEAVCKNPHTPLSRPGRNPSARGRSSPSSTTDRHRMSTNKIKPIVVVPKRVDQPEWVPPSFPGWIPTDPFESPACTCVSASHADDSVRVLVVVARKLTASLLLPSPPRPCVYPSSLVWWTYFFANLVQLGRRSEAFSRFVSAKRTNCDFFWGGKFQFRDRRHRRDGKDFGFRFQVWWSGFDRDGRRNRCRRISRR